MTQKKLPVPKAQAESPVRVENFILIVHGRWD